MRVGEYCDLRGLKLPPLLNNAVTADELRKWPLMHGYLPDKGDADRIRKTGLLAPGPDGRATNTFDYDRELERHNLVFLSTPSFKIDYGFGLFFVLVDPAVLRENGVSFADQDIGNAVECIKVEGESPGNWIGRGVKDLESLKRIITHKYIYNESASHNENAMRVVQSEAFKDYYNKNYKMGEKEFFGAIQQEAAQEGVERIADYFNRTGIWGLQEEIQVPLRVDSEYLLGAWESGKWTKWRAARNSETQHRVQQFLATLSTLWGEAHAA